MRCDTVKGSTAWKNSSEAPPSLGVKPSQLSDFFAGARRA
jgi:hypothetical protein